MELLGVTPKQLPLLEEVVEGVLEPNQDATSKECMEFKVVEETTLRVQCTQKSEQAVEVTAVVALNPEMDTQAQTIITALARMLCTEEEEAVVMPRLSPQDQAGQVEAVLVWQPIQETQQVELQTLEVVVEPVTT